MADVQMTNPQPSLMASRTAAPTAPDAEAAAVPESLRKVHQLLVEQKVDEALHIVNGRGAGAPDYQNARAVCLMRMGKPDAAISVLRGLTLAAGGVYFRDNVPLAHKINLAVALAQAGKVQGALEILNEVNSESHPQVQALRGAIDAWTRQMSTLEWVQWKLGVPVERPVPLDFAPGCLV